MAKRYKFLDVGDVAAIKWEAGFVQLDSGRIMLAKNYYGMRRDLCQKYDCSYATLWGILNGITHRDIAPAEFTETTTRKRQRVVGKRRAKQKE